MKIDGAVRECPSGCGKMILQDQSCDAWYCAQCRSWIVAGNFKPNQKQYEPEGLDKTDQLQNLLALLLQAGANLKVEDHKLLVNPPLIAKRFAPQIRELKPEILRALGYCPVCAAPLELKMIKKSFSGNPEKAKWHRHSYCSETAGHYDSWERV